MLGPNLRMNQEDYGTMTPRDLSDLALTKALMDVSLAFLQSMLDSAGNAIISRTAMAMAGMTLEDLLDRYPDCSVQIFTDGGSTGYYKLAKVAP